MKNYQYKFRLLTVILAGGLLAMFSSCEKALETKIYSQLTPDNFYKSEADVNAAVVTLYVPFTSNWDHPIPGAGNTRYAGFYNSDEKAYLLRSEITTDELHSLWNTAAASWTWNKNTWGGANNSVYYNISYVAKATQIIDDISKTNLSDALKASYIAQSKVMRAWIMYVLYDFYGPVNVKTDIETLTDSAQTPRLTKEVYSAQIVKDLTEAMPDLKDKYNTDAANWGRVSKGVARMLLLKLYMHNKEWAKAETVGKEILGMGYTLLQGANGYKNVFINKANSELIYAVPANDASPNFWAQQVFPTNYRSNPGINGGVNRDVGWYSYWMPWQFYDTYEANDLRKGTILDSYIRTGNPAGTVVNRTNGLQGAIPLKYTNVTGNGPGFAQDMVVFRLGEVLLSVAEAINEQRGPAEAYQYVNQVRSRAGVSDFSGMNTASMRTALLAERGRELYCEGVRRQDLIRNGTYVSDAVARGKTNAKPYMELFHIPDNVILAGKGVVIQNPGY